MTATSTDRTTRRGRPSGRLDPLAARLRDTCQGEVVGPGDAGYDRARAAWNLNVDHRPAVVVLAESAHDVAQSVRLAGQAGLGIGVLATGHGTPALTEDGLLVNTSRLRDVSIDPVTRTARVAAGAVWQDVMTAAAAYGLTGLPGSSTTVGVVGSTVGGGFGWLGRKYGLAAHSVIRAEVVTADGELVMTSADEHPDLFWGLLGGTSNLGLVTALEFRLHPVRSVYGGNLYYPLDQARAVLEFFAEWAPTTPVELTAAATFRSFPPLPGVPAALRGRSLVAVRGCFCGDLGAGQALVDGARDALGPGLVDTFTALSTADLATISLDPVLPVGALNHLELIRDLTPSAIDAVVEVAGPQSQSPLAMVELRQLGGALAGSPQSLDPMAHTAAAYSLNAVGVTPTPTQAAAVRDHLSLLASRIQPYATGDTYLNFLDLEGATPERIRAAYSPADWDRLVRLKTAYDPANLFRFNRNIPPSPQPHPKVSTT